MTIMEKAKDLAIALAAATSLLVVTVVYSWLLFHTFLFVFAE